MKRFFSLALAFVLFVGGGFTLSQAQSPQVRQIILTSRNTASAGFTPSCTQSTNWLARATNVVLTSDKQNYDNLLCGLETDGVGCSTTIDALYVWATVDRTTALLNLCSASFAATEAGAVNFTAYQGYTGDGSTFRLDTGFNPSSGTPQSTPNSTSFMVYVLNLGASFGYVSGVASASNSQLFFFPSTTTFWIVTDGANRAAVVTPTSGQWIASRTASNALALYKNSSTTAVDSGTDAASGGPSNANVFFFDSNNGSPPNSATTAKMSAGFIGAGLSSAQMALAAARINTYMTAYGINTY